MLQTNLKTTNVYLSVNKKSIVCIPRLIHMYANMAMHRQFDPVPLMCSFIGMCIQIRSDNYIALIYTVNIKPNTCT